MMPGPSERKHPNPWRKVRHVANGLSHAVRNDASVATITAVSTVVVVASVVFARWVDLMLVVVVTAQALAAELINTAIERLCDFVERRHSPQIGAIKDIAAAAVGIAVVVWAATVVYEYVNFIRLIVRGT